MTETKEVLRSINKNIARLNEILDWEGVGNRRLLLCFFKA
jgi:hypothetical protein